MNKKSEKYNFDQVIKREGTNAIKWDNDFMERYLGVKDALPLWVADMDFQLPDFLIAALVDRAKHGIFGYTKTDKKYNQAIINWFEKRHQWKIEEEWIGFSPGVVPAINFIIQTFSRPGDGVIIQEPVYYPFADSIKKNGRKVLNNELIIKEGEYKIDFDDFKKKCESPRAKIFILCSPHNPISRVWNKEEL